jgi:hypothetical protein
MITIAYINFWKDSYNDDYFTKFIKHNIGPVKIVNYRQNPDILIASCFGPIDRIKYSNAKLKLFYYGENLDRYPPYNDYKLLQNTFDLIVGFKPTDLTQKQIRFPLWLINYDYYKWDDNDNILTYIQNKYNKNIKNKKVFSTIVCKHDRGGQRTLIYDELQKYGEIKSPGKYRNNTAPIGNTSEDKINYISRGLYTICPENSSFEGYFTEKIFQAFEAGTIPLYWAIDLPETSIINKNKYCFCDIQNKENLKKSIHNVCNNPDEYINGDLFTNQASEEIKLFYSTLSDNIKLNIKL